MDSLKLKFEPSVPSTPSKTNNSQPVIVKAEFKRTNEVIAPFNPPKAGKSLKKKDILDEELDKIE